VSRGGAGGDGGKIGTGGSAEGGVVGTAGNTNGHGGTGAGGSGPVVAGAGGEGGEGGATGGQGGATGGQGGATGGDGGATGGEGGATGGQGGASGGEGGATGGQGGATGGEGGVTGGSAGEGGEGGGREAIRIGDVIANVSTVELDVNVHDGFLDPSENQSWTLDVSSRVVHYEDTDGTVLDQVATPEQTQALLQLVSDTQYYEREPCSSQFAIDGAPFSPELRLASSGQTKVLGVSDATCIPSDHSFYGPAISCDAYSAISSAFIAIIQGQPLGRCGDYW
jgi:hypothetical protein